MSLISKHVASFPSFAVPIIIIFFFLLFEGEGVILISIMYIKMGQQFYYRIYLKKFDDLLSYKLLCSKVKFHKCQVLNLSSFLYLCTEL